MAETTDAVLPILRKIQTDIATINDHLEDVAEVLRDHGDRLKKIESNTAFHRGMTLQHQFDLDNLRQDVDSLKSRVKALETQE